MPKRDDDAADVATSRNETLDRMMEKITPPTRPEVNEPSEPAPAPRLRKLHAVVTEEGHWEVTKAVTLHQALQPYDPEWSDDFPASQGRALVEICRRWRASMNASLKAKGNNDEH